MTGGQWKRWRAAGTMVAAGCDGNGDSDDKKYTRDWRLRADADGALTGSCLTISYVTISLT